MFVINVRFTCCIIVCCKLSMGFYGFQVNIPIGILEYFMLKLHLRLLQLHVFMIVRVDFNPGVPSGIHSHFTASAPRISS